MTSPAFSFYAKDWLAATLTWSLEARGAYVTLLAYQWDAGFIPFGFDNLARLLAVREPRARQIWDIIGTKFIYNAELLGWQNARLEVERQKQQDRREQLSANGAQGGRPKKPKGFENENRDESYRFVKDKPNENQNESLASSSSFASSEFPPNPPQTGGEIRVRREHREQAKLVLKSRLGYCQHDPQCPNQVACLDVIAHEIAQKAIAS